MGLMTADSDARGRSYCTAVRLSLGLGVCGAAGRAAGRLARDRY